MTPLNGALRVTCRAAPPVNFGLLNRFDVKCFIPTIISCFITFARIIQKIFLPSLKQPTRYRYYIFVAVKLLGNV